MFCYWRKPKLFYFVTGPKPGPEFRCCCIDNNGEILVELLSRLAPWPRLSQLISGDNEPDEGAAGPGAGAPCVIRPEAILHQGARQPDSHRGRAGNDGQSLPAVLIPNSLASIIQPYIDDSELNILHWILMFGLGTEHHSPPLFLYHKANFPLNCPYIWGGLEWMTCGCVSPIMVIPWWQTELVIMNPSCRLTVAAAIILFLQNKLK